MFSTAATGGKAFAAEQKIRELKKRISTRPNEIISKAVDNMNSIPTIKYGVAPDTAEEKLLSSEAYKAWFDIRGLQKVSKPTNRYGRCETKKYFRKKKKLRQPLEIGEEVFLLSSRLKKKIRLDYFTKV